jgi:uncharacterized glyoxalase superfamily protein PhnB
MLKNRSVPTDAVLPHIYYQDMDAAIVWLTRTFGFKELYRYGNPLSGAQMQLGNACIQISRPQPGSLSPAQLGYGTQSLTIFVNEIEAHYSRTKDAGVELVEDLHETVYGELQYAARDLDGHLWLFSRHARDLNPEDWGATLAKS